MTDPICYLTSTVFFLMDWDFCLIVFNRPDFYLSLLSNLFLPTDVTGYTLEDLKPSLYPRPFWSFPLLQTGPDTSCSPSSPKDLRLSLRLKQDELGSHLGSGHPSPVGLRLRGRCVPKNAETDLSHVP